MIELLDWSSCGECPDIDYCQMVGMSCVPTATAAPVDWPARFRAAGDAAGSGYWDEFYNLADSLEGLAAHRPDLVEAIGRALNGVPAETETAAELAGRDGDTTHA